MKTPYKQKYQKTYVYETHHASIALRGLSNILLTEYSVITMRRPDILISDF